MKYHVTSSFFLFIGQVIFRNSVILTLEDYRAKKFNHLKKLLKFSVQDVCW